MTSYHQKKTSFFQRTLVAAAVATFTLGGVSSAWADKHHHDDDDDDDEVKITFIHSGDFHGDYHPHTNARGDAAGSLEGGMARAVTVIDGIRKRNKNVIHVHTGDTIHGSGEASITKGMNMVRMVDQLGIDVSTPGNWEWAYTPYRYFQFFGVHDADGNNMDIVADDDFDVNAPKAVKYKKGSPYAEDNVGDVPTFGTPFRAVKYVESYNEDGTPNMAVGYNRWGMVAANTYRNGTWRLDHGTVEKGTGMNMTPPYRIIEKGGVKIGFIGCTTNRGPQVVSSTITTGVTFSGCKGDIKFPQNRPIDWDDLSYSHGGTKDNPGGQTKGNPASAGVQAANRDSAKEAADDVLAPDGPRKPFEPTGWDNMPHWGGIYGYQVVSEIEKWTNHLRDVEGVDLVAVMSEAGIAENIYAAENLVNMDNGPDLYFSSDMHEETNFPVVVTDPRGKKVIITENPEDIAQISRLEIKVKNGKIVKWKFEGIDIDESIAEDPEMEDLANQIDQEIADKIAAGDASNPYNNNVIVNQLDEVVGVASNIVVERNRFSTEWDPANKIMPGVIEGTGHALVTDMFRKLTGADVGGLRGFRYTNSVLDGDDIDYASMYHMFPIGAQVAVAAIPTTPASEKALPTVQYYDVNAGCQNDIDSNCNGVVLFDQADNKRHFVGFPRSLQQEMELGMNSSHNPNVPAWGGGWSWQYSGITWDSQPAGEQFARFGQKESARISNITLYDNADPAKNGPIDQSSGAKVTYASYYYHPDSNRINRNQIVTQGSCTKNGYAWPAERTKCAAELGGIRILTKTADGDYVMADGVEYDAGIASGDLQVLDATEALGRYISAESIDVYDWVGGAKGALLHTVAGLNGTFEGNDFVYPRANLIKADGTPGNDLTDCTIEFGSPCIQPFRGAEAGLGINTSLPAGYIKGTADAPSLKGKIDYDDDDDED
jgi:2',3'-cyclic-nucleotide 2'-phosphodiesterase (5'-nucleotidase family)